MEPRQATARPMADAADAPVGQPRRAAHENGGDGRLPQVRQELRRIAAQHAAHGDEVQHGDDGIAGDGADGSARDGDIRVADENVVDDDLDDAADERVDDGDDGVVVRLHDGVRHEHDAVEHHGDAEDGHELRGEREVRAGVAAKQGDDGLCQHDEADGAGHGDEAHESQRRILHGAHAAAVLQRQAVRNGRDDGDGDAGNEGAGEVEDSLAVVINTLDDVRALLRVARGIDEAVHDRRRIEQVDDLQTGCAERDGHGNGQQALERLACGSCPAPPRG